MRCDNCGIDFSSKFCPACGTPAALRPAAESAVAVLAPAPVTHCGRCGTSFESKFCPECGAAGSLQLEVREAGGITTGGAAPGSRGYANGDAAYTRMPGDAAAPGPQMTNIVINNTVAAVNENTQATVNQNTNAQANTPAYYGPGARGVSRKNRTVALVLAIVLGVLGGHQFYAGKTGMGLLYFFTGGLFGIGWVVDIIRIVLGSFRDQYGLDIQEW